MIVDSMMLCLLFHPLSVLTLLVGRQEGHSACKTHHQYLIPKCSVLA